MSKRKEIRAEIEKIKQIFLTAKECYLYSKYLFAPDDPDERRYASKDMHFRIMAILFWRLCIIEIHKLVSDSEKDEFRLSFFISKLKTSGHFRILKISEEKIKTWEKRLDDANPYIDKIRGLRDKSYAHTDRDEDKVKEMAVSFPEVNEILNITGEIIQEMYYVVYDSHFLLDTPGFEWKKPAFLKHLTDGDKRFAVLEKLVDDLSKKGDS